MARSLWPPDALRARLSRLEFNASSIAKTFPASSLAECVAANPEPQPCTMQHVSCAAAAGRAPAPLCVGARVLNAMPMPAPASVLVHTARARVPVYPCPTPRARVPVARPPRGLPPLADTLRPCAQAGTTPTSSESAGPSLTLITRTTTPATTSSPAGLTRALPSPCPTGARNQSQPHCPLRVAAAERGSSGGALP